MNRMTFAQCLGAGLLASSALAASAQTNPVASTSIDWSCSDNQFSLSMLRRDTDLRQHTVRQIQRDTDGSIRWSVRSDWRSSTFDAKGSMEVRFEGVGIYAVGGPVPPGGGAPAFVRVGPEIPAVQFEPINFGVYTKALGLINPSRPEIIYSGCVATAPPIPMPPPPFGQFPPDAPYIITVCSKGDLTPFGGAIPQPSVPSYSNRQICLRFNLLGEAGPVLDSAGRGYTTPIFGRNSFSPVDFISLSYVGAPSVCRYAPSQTCVTGAECQVNTCVPTLADPSKKACSIPRTGFRDIGNGTCNSDADCSTNLCRPPELNRPVGPAQLYGIQLKVITDAAVAPRFDSAENRDLLSRLMQPWLERRADATARGVVTSQVVGQRALGDGRTESTIVYLFRSTVPDGPMTFITRWE